MAQKKNTKSKSNKKPQTAPAPQKLSKEQLEAIRVTKSRMWSSIIFIIGVLVAFLTYIQGQAAWKGAHDILWGLFGIATIFLAPIVIYVAVMLALDKSKSSVTVKIAQGAILLLLVGPALELISSFIAGTEPYSGEGFKQIVFNLYNHGVQKLGGGTLSIIIGGSLNALCGSVCALIIIVLLIVLFVMLLTNITPVDVWNFFVRCFKKFKSTVDENRAEVAEANAIKASEEKEELKKTEEKRIDIAKFIPEEENMPAHPVVAETVLPVIPVKEVKESEPKKAKVKRVKKSMMPGDFIPQEDSNVIESPEVVNPIYVDEDGQTTLIENDTTSKSQYMLPPVDLLNLPRHSVSQEEIKFEVSQNSETLVETLKSFGVSTRITEIHRGPSVTRYELQPAAGVKVSKITGLVDDIALNLAASGVRIEAPIPGKAAVGIELANKSRDIVYMRELVDSDAFKNMKSKISFPVGKNIEGEIITVDIGVMPHLLIAGTTGSGKSVLTNSIIMSILYNASPDEVKFILIDPKQVEFPIYNGIPHLLIPVVTEARKAAGALGWAVTEMMKRYNMFANSGVRDIKEYNEFVKDKEKLSPLPKIVIVVDELADLMMAAPKEVEDSICRLAQLARAAGMHLIIATQSPRVDVVTGLIKANIDSRIALRVSNQIDSRVILDDNGAEKLLKYGDLLLRCSGFDKPLRIQGGLVTTEEIRRVVDYLKAQETTNYDEEIANEIEKLIPVPKAEKTSASQDDQAPDPNSDESIIDRAIEVIVENGQASTSFLQRKLRLGYARAARIVDELEEMGIVGPADGAKPREIKISRAQWLERKASIGGTPSIDMPIVSDFVDDEEEL